MGGFDLKFYLSIFIRRLPYFLVVSVLVTAIGLSVALTLPAVYRAQATIAVESEQIPGELAASTVGVSATEQIQVIEQRLMTRDTLLTLARAFDVFAAEPGLSLSEQVAAMRARTQFIVINRGRDGLITFTISFSSPDPAQAAAVVNEIVSLVLAENIRLRTGRATDTLQFFEDEVERLGGILGEISADILAFTTENQDPLPESLEFRRSEQERLQERLLQLEREETALRDQRVRLVRLYENTGRITRDRADLTEEEQELRTQKAELERQRALLSDSHPRIRLLESRIAALEAVVAEQRVGVGEGDEVRQLSELDVELERIDGRLAYLDAEQVRLEAELDALAESIRQTPANEIRLSALERRYDNIQEQYDAAVASLSAAATGERLEVLSKGERFGVIEQAVPPGWPDSPNRKLIAAASLAAGGGAGMGLVVLLELLNRSVRRPVDITRGLGIQTFGTIPYVRTRRERRIKRGVIASVLVLFGVGVPAAIWAVHVYYRPLDVLIVDVAEKAGLGSYVERLF